MSKDPFKINLRIQVARDGGKQFYPSTIQDIEDNIIYISVPLMEKNQPMILQKNERIQVKFVGENEQFIFSTYIVKRKMDKIILFGFKYPKEDEINRIQMRDFYRLVVSLKVKYKLAAQLADNLAPDAEAKEDEHWKEGALLDISAGGIKLAAPDNLPYKGQLLISINEEIDEVKLNLEVKGEILRKEQIFITPKKSVFHYGIKFTNITDRQRDGIVRYVFEKSRKSKTLL